MDVSLSPVELSIDGERNFSLPSDHVMIHTSFQYKEGGGGREVEVISRVEGWSRKRLRDDVLIRQYSSNMEEIWDNIYDGQNGSIQHKYDVMVQNIREEGMKQFSFVVQAKNEYLLPPQLIRMKSEIRKLRKQIIRRNKRLQLPLGDLYGQLWRVRMKLRSFISKRYERKMKKISD